MALDPDHPGFRDAAYRQRRNTIAQAALAYREGDPVPDVVYTPQEHGVWREVWRHLEPLHERYACGRYRDAAALVQIEHDSIPQLADVNVRLRPAHGFQLMPVAGLVAAQLFLSCLARGVFLSTQYVRHPSRPLYTPEPDVIHELVGHAGTLADVGFAALSRAFGAAALQAPDEHAVEAIARVYWYTLEFGAVREGGSLKAYGAGLLSSYGELERLESGPRPLPLDVERMARTPYDPTGYQPLLFVGQSLDQVFDETLGWLAAFGADRAGGA